MRGFRRSGRVRLHPLLPALMLISLCFSAAPAQTATGDTVYHLRGRVMNGTTGKSVSRALVISADRRMATMTDAAGRFDLVISVPPEGGGPSGQPPNGFTDGALASRGGLGGLTVMLTAKKPGYLDPEQLTSLELDTTLSSREVELQLLPAGSIDGRVSATETDSAHDVRVTLLQHQVQDGSYHWVQAGSDTTDSHGEYHFGNLHPGEYTLVTATWRGERPLNQPRLTVTQQYPPMFLGDASGVSTAAKLEIHSGEAAHADLHLRLASYYPVTVPVQVSAEGTGVQVQLSDTEFNPGYNLSFSARDGAVRGTLPNGTYTLLLSSNAPQPSFASVPLHVQGAPVQTSAVAFAPSPHIAVRVHAELTGSGRDYPLSVSLLLRPAREMGVFANGNLPPNAGDEFFVENARPGSYFVQVQAGGAYVAALRCGGADLLHDTLTVPAGGLAEPIDVTVRDDGAQITGKVTIGTGTLPPHSFVLLVPTDRNGVFSQSFAGPDGTFRLGNLAPGNYRAFALRKNRMQVPYREPEAMHAYDGKGTSFTATAGGKVQVDVPLLEVIDGQVR